MIEIMWIGMGGFVGAALRYLTGAIMQRLMGQNGFLYGTFAVNFIGSLLIGYLITTANTSGFMSLTAQTFLVTGLLGAFTTFSTFSYQTWDLMQQGKTSPAVINLSVHLVFGIAAVWMGGLLARFWHG